ncbi:hypothetical protein AIZ09_23160, partial [Salmonella enterica subsp. enterica serovar Typhimurium]
FNNSFFFFSFNFVFFIVSRVYTLFLFICIITLLSYVVISHSYITGCMSFVAWAVSVFVAFFAIFL